MSHLSLPLRLGQRVLGSKIISLRPGVFSRAVHPSRVSMDEKPSEPPGASEIDPKEKLKELLKRVKVTKQADSEAEAEKYRLRATPIQRLGMKPEDAKQKSKPAKRTFGKPKQEPLIVPSEEKVVVSPDLLVAAESVAKHQASRKSDDKDVRFQINSKTKSDLLKKLQEMSEETQEAKLANEIVRKDNMADLFENLKVEKKSESQTLSTRRALSMEEKNFLERRKKLRRSQKEEGDFQGQIKLYESEDALGIFTKGAQLDNQQRSLNPTWDRCRQREMKILSQFAPRNFLEEMASWTENGILWHFPINNEQGIDEATMEPFYKHVFLEPHLEPWCPQRGPLRHFMELVVVGLSKNPHISVEKKIEHIHWFRDYFDQADHKEILKLSGALDV